MERQLELYDTQFTINFAQSYNCLTYTYQNLILTAELQYFSQGLSSSHVKVENAQIHELCTSTLFQMTLWNKIHPPVN